MTQPAPTPAQPESLFPDLPTSDPNVTVTCGKLGEACRHTQPLYRDGSGEFHQWAIRLTDGQVLIAHHWDIRVVHEISQRQGIEALPWQAGHEYGLSVFNLTLDDDDVNPDLVADVDIRNKATWPREYSEDFPDIELFSHPIACMHEHLRLLVLDIVNGVLDFTREEAFTPPPHLPSMEAYWADLQHRARENTGMNTPTTPTPAEPQPVTRAYYLPHDFQGPVAYEYRHDRQRPHPHAPSAPYKNDYYNVPGPELEVVPGGNTRMVAFHGTLYIALIPGTTWTQADRDRAVSLGYTIPQERRFVFTNKDTLLTLTATEPQELAERLKHAGVGFSHLFASRLFAGDVITDHPEGWTGHEEKGGPA